MQLNNSESEQQNKADLIGAKAAAFQAIEHGTAILGEMGRQQEYLDQAEDTLEANDNILDQANKVIRNMTWSGYMYNMASSVGGGITPQPTYHEDGARNLGTHRNTSNNNNSNSNSNSTGGQGQARDTGGNRERESRNQPKPTDPYGTMNSNNANNGNGALIQSQLYYNEQDNQLDEISAAVASLEELSLVIGQKLEAQNNQIEVLDERTHEVHDKTLSVSLKASKMTARSKGKIEPRIVGMFQFVDVRTGKFLSVDENENITLSSVPDRSTHFNIYSKEQDLMGIQSVKNLKYIGYCIWGSMGCSGTYLGSSEECYLTLSGEETGIFFVSRNWGNGGWLKYPPAVGGDGEKESNSKSMSKSMSKSKSGVYFTTTSSSIHDKEGCLMVRAIPEESMVKPAVLTYAQKRTLMP